MKGTGLLPASFLMPQKYGGITPELEEADLKPRLKLLPAALLAVAACIVFTGCGQQYATAGTINGEEIPAGLYLSMQYSNYTTAKSKVEDSEKDVFRQKIDGESAKKWIQQQTEEKLAEYVCVEQMCFERGITLSEENQSTMQQMMSNLQGAEGLYEVNGIGTTSLMKVGVNQLLKEQLFLELYGPEGDKAVSDEALKTGYEEKNANISYIMVPRLQVTEEEEGAEAADDRLAETEAVAQKMLDGLKSGKTMEEVTEAYLPEAYEIAEREYTDTTPASAMGTSYMAYEPATTAEDESDTEYLVQLKEDKVGDFGVFTMGANVIVYEKIPTFADDTEFDEMRDTVLRELYFSDYEDYLRSIYEQYPIEWTTGARWYMRPGKIVENENN